MNHKELKQQVLTELNTILEMSILEVENLFNDKPENYHRYTGWLYKGAGNEMAQFLHSYSYCLPETWQIKHEQMTINFPSCHVPTLLKDVKTGFSDGTEPKHKEKSKKQQDFNGIELQKWVAEKRATYQQKSNYPDDENVYFGGRWRLGATVNALIKQDREIIERLYKKSGDGDLIRLCWKYITNPDQVEGVNVAWQQEPKAKFYPVGTYEVPENMTTKTCVA